MDLEAARKALSKQGTYSSKRVAFFGVVGVCLVAGVLLRLGLVPQSQVDQNSPVAAKPSQTPAVETTKSVSQPVVEQNAPGAAAAAPPATATPAVEGTEPLPQSSLPAQNAVTGPTEQVAPTGNAIGEPEPAGKGDEHAEPGLPDPGLILVARRPVEVLASPSSSAPALYGFPAGRPFRVIGRQGGFAHIQDLRSNASGWINEGALAHPPPAPTAAVPAQPGSFSTGGNPPQEESTAIANPKVATQPDRRRPGLFGRGGLFGGIFGNGN